MGFPLEPLSSFIIIKFIEKKEKILESGLIMPETTVQRPAKGIVVAAGPGQVVLDGKRVPTQVKPGDKVYFGRFAPITLEYQELSELLSEEQLTQIDKNDTYALLSDGEVYCKVVE